MLLIKHVQIYEKKTNCFCFSKESGAYANTKNEANIYCFDELSDAGFGYSIFADNQVLV